MKNLALVFFCCAIWCCGACKKDRTSGSGLKTDYFVFGSSYGMCRSNCTHLFMLKDEQLYADSMDRTLSPLYFQSTPLSMDKADRAKHLLSIYPAYLNKGTDQTIGCPDCHDQGTLYIEYRDGSAIRKIRIDTDEKEYPAEIRDFVKELKATIEVLKS